MTFFRCDGCRREYPLTHTRWTVRKDSDESRDKDFCSTRCIGIWAKAQKNDAADVAR